MHTGHGLVVGLGFVQRAIARIILVDADPVHMAAAGDLISTHNRDVVFRLTRNGTSATARADVEIDSHAPFVIEVFPLIIVVKGE